MTTDSSWIDYTQRDYAALRQAMLDLAAERLGDVWTDRSDNDIGVVLVETFAHMGDLLLYYLDRLAAESYPDTAVERRSLVHLLRLIGYELRPPVPASADLTLRFAHDSTATVVVDSTTKFSTSAAETGEAISFRYVGKDALEIDLSAIPVTTDEGGTQFKELAQKVPVQQVDRVIASELVGSSDGSAGQRFALRDAPLIDASLEVWVDEGSSSGARRWTRVEHLLDSGATDEHYIVRRSADDAAWVEFGNGRNGRIPRRRRNNISAFYRVGGGVRGNVPANTITKSEPNLTDLEQVFNALAASGGMEREDTETAVARAPLQYRTQRRAVTAADYEALALAFGVAKVRARAPGWNVIDLYVAPQGSGYPSDLLKQDLVTFLEDKRMMTSIVRIQDPTYVKVRIRAILEVEPYYFTNQVQRAVEDAVAALYEFSRVTFEQTLYLSKVYEAIEGVDGVLFTAVEVFALGDLEILPPEGKLQLGWSELPYFEGIEWTSVSGGLTGV